MAAHSLHPETWVESFGDLLLRFAIKRVPERDIARDLVQDTFVTAIKSKENYRGEISEKNWLFLILKSRILDHYKKKKETLASDLVSDDDDDQFFGPKGNWLQDKLPKEWTTDKMVRNNEFMEVLEACRDKLKDMQRLVFTMKYIDGEEAEDICKELDISSSNYWVLVHRAKLKLRQCIEVNWFEQ